MSLRFFTVYGPKQRPDMAFNRFIRAALTGQPITLYGDGAQTRDFTFIADIVAACRAAGDRGRLGAVYNIGGGSRVSITEVLDLIGRLTKRSLKIQQDPSKKGTCETRLRTPPERGPTWDLPPSATLESGLAAEVEWLSRLVAPVS